jgi:hypothetical protein
MSELGLCDMRENVTLSRGLFTFVNSCFNYLRTE